MFESSITFLASALLTHVLSLVLEAFSLRFGLEAASVSLGAHP